MLLNPREGKDKTIPRLPSLPTSSTCRRYAHTEFIGWQAPCQLTDDTHQKARGWMASMPPAPAEARRQDHHPQKSVKNENRRRGPRAPRASKPTERLQKASVRSGKTRAIRYEAWTSRVTDEDVSPWNAGNPRQLSLPLVVALPGPKKLPSHDEKP